MANFDELIRQALFKQDSSNPAIREQIYQSSRAALLRMIERKGDVSPAVAERQQGILEQSILKIENEFLAPPSSASPVQAEYLVASSPPAPPPVVPVENVVRQEVPLVSPEPVISTDREVAPQPVAAPEPVSQYADEEFEVSDHEPDLTSRYKTRRRVIKFVGFIGLLAVVALVAYVSYLLVLALIDKNTGDQPQNREVNRVSALNPVDGENPNPSQYITLLEPNDPSTIVTDGAGQARIVNDVEATVLRIVSLRANFDKSQPAKPILLEILPGILSQIRGKKITVEILAKSGSSGPATFSVECMFGEIGSCGRKRFRVGLQPEAVVFSIDVKGENLGEKAYLAIRTDIASSANLSGRGDVLDIISARLRIVGDR
ncbi:MAG: hypothetical protein COB78_04815 [Hyphomicrobiales bacterium]|nr:MAG: hypothetical protein COB78_04815 [Hyphomicrobiales bacterium]